jgi:methionine synthase I (cobalamin-dependent)/5,10-methylenetetrahydrofolate reductase
MWNCNGSASRACPQRRVATIVTQLATADQGRPRRGVCGAGCSVLRPTDPCAAGADNADNLFRMLPGGPGRSGSILGMNMNVSRASTSRASPSRARRSLTDRLAAGPLLFDGAMGTFLYSLGIPQRACLEELVATRPDLVTAVHRDYIAAGAEAIETCSFGANRLHLAAWGLGDRAAYLSRRAAQLAREARDVAGRDVLVAGSVGPVPHLPGSRERPPLKTVEDALSEQIEGLLEGGVDLLVIESASHLDELLAAVSVARSLTDLPVLALMTFGLELRAMDGTEPAAAGAALARVGVDAAGVNCGAGPAASLEALQRMAVATGELPLAIMPNAGLPQRIEGRFVYAADPAYFAGICPDFLAAGARVLGGCCGTTPDHIRAMRTALDATLKAGMALEAGTGVARPSTGGGVQGATPSVSGAAVLAELEAPQPETAAGRPDRPGLGAVSGPAQPPAERSGLARALSEGRFVISVEIDPPRSIWIERTLEAARLVREAGADLVNISDSAMARVRMGAMAVAFAISREVGIETLVHVTTRDRNLMALESELLGAHALGIRNILALTGDAPAAGSYGEGTGVWDVDSIGLIGILARLNRGEDQAGTPTGGQASFTIACALDPTAADLEGELERLMRKAAAGAHLILTQPIYDRRQWETMLDRVGLLYGLRRLPLPVLLGVLPLHSWRHAEFLHHEVPGITIPEEVRETMRRAGDRASAVGLELAESLIDELRDQVAGIYVMPSFGRYEHAAELVRKVRAQLGRFASLLGGSTTDHPVTVVARAAGDLGQSR